MRISDWSSVVCSSDLIGLYISMNSAGQEGAAQAIRAALFHAFADRYLPGPAPAARVDAKTARKHAAMMAGHYASSRGSFTDFMSLFGLLGQAKIVVDEDGRIAMPALDGLSAASRDWVEVEPCVWRDRATGALVEAEGQDRHVERGCTRGDGR